MINQEKVREMTHMAMLESGIGERELHISSYRRIDYVAFSVIRGVVAGTVCFAAFCALWFCRQWDTLNQYFADADFMGFIKKVLFCYIVFMAAYLVLCGVVAAKRHKKCKKRKMLYLRYLHKIEKTYAGEGET